MAADKHAEHHFRLQSSDFETDDVQIRRIEGREAISQPFRFDVELVVTNTEGLDPDKVLGATASLVFERNGEEVRSVHGMVTSLVDLLEVDAAHRTYRIRLVPRMHRLTFVETQEVFLGLSVPDIVKQKLSLVNLGGTEVDMRLLEKYPARDIVVQYRETDLAFVSRLAEHLGISFYFDHEGGADKLVFVDRNEGFARLDRFPRMEYHGRGERQGVFRVEAERHLFPSNYAVLDYDYRAPHLELTSTHEHSAGYAGGVAEYGSHHRTPADGDKLARIRAEEREGLSSFFRCESDRFEIMAGAVVGLEGHARLDDPSLLIVEVEHRAVQAVSTHGGSGDEKYTNTFKAVDATRPYRPPRVTPRPRIHGVLTAITEPAPHAASGRIAQIDDQGRYTVKFFFDVAGEPRRQSSAPVRMAQPHAGGGYGMHFPLKPNVEVTVYFVDGDPDRPIIAGAVPNPVTVSPVTAREAVMNRLKTESGILVQIKDA